MNRWTFVGRFPPGPGLSGSAISTRVSDRRRSSGARMWSPGAVVCVGHVFGLG